MKKIIFKILRFLLFLSIGLILLYFAFRGIDADKLWMSFKTARYGWIIFSVFFGFLSVLSRAYRWNLLIEPLGYRPTFRNSLYSLSTGYLANYAFPRLGEITRCGSLAKAEKIPMDKLIGTVIIERVTDLIMVFILFLILVFGRFDFFGTFLHENIMSPLLEKLNHSFVGSAAFWIMIMLPIAVVAFYLIFRTRLSEFAAVQRLKSVVKGIFSGLKTIYTMKRKWSFILHTIFIWLLYWLMSWVAVFALPATSELKLIDGLFLLVVGSFGFIAPVQGGIGAYHYLITLGLTLYHVPREEGLTFATITHGSQSLMLILFGLLSMLILFSFNRKRNAGEVVPGKDP